MTPFVCGWGGMRALVAMTVRCVEDRNELGAEDGRHVLWCVCRPTWSCGGRMGGGGGGGGESGSALGGGAVLCCALVVYDAVVAIADCPPAVAPSLES